MPEWVTVCLCVRVPNTLNVPESVRVCVWRVCVWRGYLDSRRERERERYPSGPRATEQESQELDPDASL